jgi:uncharacterized membrane protein YbhN (UPF0104 family)
VNTTAVIGFASALGINNVPYSVFFVYIPVGSLLMAVPVSLSGWGVGEAIYSYLFAQVGVSVERGIILTLLIRVGNLGIGLIGGAVWLLEKCKVVGNK